MSASSATPTWSLWRSRGRSGPSVSRSASAAGTVEWREVPDPSLAPAAREAIVAPVAAASCDVDAAILAGYGFLDSRFALGHKCVARVTDGGLRRGVPQARLELRRPYGRDRRTDPARLRSRRLGSSHQVPVSVFGVVSPPPGSRAPPGLLPCGTTNLVLMLRRRPAPSCLTRGGQASGVTWMPPGPYLSPPGESAPALAPVPPSPSPSPPPPRPPPRPPPPSPSPSPSPSSRARSVVSEASQDTVA